MKRIWSPEELKTHWVLSANDQALLKGKSEAGRLLVSVLLKHYQRYAFVPQSVLHVSVAIAHGKAYGSVMLGIAGTAQKARADEQAYFMLAMNGVYDGMSAYSGVIRPVIPITSGHPFRFDPAGDSGLSGHPKFT